MTMKMISSTSSTSISGVTLISAVCPPPGAPVAIAITVFPSSSGPQADRCSKKPLRLRWRRRSGAGTFLFCEQAQLVHARGADVVHDSHHKFVLGAGVGPHEHL